MHAWEKLDFKSSFKDSVSVRVRDYKRDTILKVYKLWLDFLMN